MAERHGVDWTEEEATLALALYCQIPFSRTKAGEPTVRALAARLGRTPASVARKLGNFGSFDPTLAARGVVGLTHASRTDRVVWERYAGRWDALAEDAADGWPDSPLLPDGPSETMRPTKARLHQAFFRASVLAGYDRACCVCGLEVPELLRASHIVPWSADESLRADPANGLCFCAIHDVAFDRGFVTVSEDWRLLVSPALASARSDGARTMFLAYAGAAVAPPRRFVPSGETLARHRETVFRSTA